MFNADFISVFLKSTGICCTAFFNDFASLDFYTYPLPGSAHKLLTSHRNTFCPKGTPSYGSGASNAICTLVCNVDLPAAWLLCDESSFAFLSYCQNAYGLDFATENRPISNLVTVKNKVYP